MKRAPEGPPPATQRAIVWFRRDLRLADNPALVAALRMAPEVVRRAAGAPGPLAQAPQPAPGCGLLRLGLGPSWGCMLALPGCLPADPPACPLRRRSDSAACAAACPPPSLLLQLPVYIWAPEEEGQFQPGRCSRWWLAASLRALDADLRALGSRLLAFRAPDSRALLTRLAREWGAGAVLFNHL